MNYRKRCYGMTKDDVIVNQPYGVFLWTNQVYIPRLFGKF